MACRTADPEALKSCLCQLRAVCPWESYLLPQFCHVSHVMAPTSWACCVDANGMICESALPTFWHTVSTQRQHWSLMGHDFIIIILFKRKKKGPDLPQPPVKPWHVKVK